MAKSKRARTKSKKPSWLEKRLARVRKSREEVVNSMIRVARENKGLIPLLRTSSSVSKSSLLTPMLQNGLVTTRGNSIKRDVVALDCEMVGVGVRGSRSVLGRCSIVGYDGNILYDSYVRPCQPITDFRTIFSGIRRCHMEHAKPFEEALREIKAILADKMIVGHDLKNDFNAINLMDHPQTLIRDTAHLDILQLGHMPSLKLLTKVCLNYDIQEGSHCSLIDARACMNIYKLVEDSWEKSSTHVEYNNCFGEMQLLPILPPPIRTDICELSSNGGSHSSAIKSSNYLSLHQSSESSSAAISWFNPSSLKMCHDDDRSVTKEFRPHMIVGIHCDLVPMPSGKKQVVRCAILDGNKKVCCKKNVLPVHEVKESDVINYDLNTDQFRSSAKPLTLLIPEIKQILAGKTVVGHGLSEQFRALGLPLSEYTYRDTAESLMVREKADLPLDHTPNLSNLTKVILHHQPKKEVLKRARNALRIYKLFAKEWEDGLGTCMTMHPGQRGNGIDKASRNAI